MVHVIGSWNMALDARSCCCACNSTVCSDAFFARISPLAFLEGYILSFYSVMYYLLLSAFCCYINFSLQDEKAKAISVLEKIYDSDRLEEEVELLASSSMHEFQSDGTGSYLDIFKSKELRLAFFAGAGLQVCSSSSILAHSF